MHSKLRFRYDGDSDHQLGREYAHSGQGYLGARKGAQGIHLFGALQDLLVKG
jgi:hypothetical protein